jgi:hypothetical protein
VRPTNTPVPPPPPPPPAPAAPPPPPPPAAAPAATFSVVGFSDLRNADDSAPASAARSGGTLNLCNPSSLNAFVSFSGLQPPKQFVGSWTKNGAFLGQSSFTQDRASAQSYFRIGNSPTPLTAGSYTFTLRVDGNVATSGSFTLVC